MKVSSEKFEFGSWKSLFIMFIVSSIIFGIGIDLKIATIIVPGITGLIGTIITAIVKIEKSSSY